MLSKLILIIGFALLTGCNTKNTDNIEVKHEEKVQKKTIPENPSVNVKPNQIISSPFEIRVNSEAVWFGFEGELGTVLVVDDDNNELGRAILSTLSDDWMTDKLVMYGSTLTFDTKGALSGKLLFFNNNPSKTEGMDKQFEIPILFAEQSDPNDKLIGSWFLTEPAEADISFMLNADGSAKSLSMATLLYHKWRRVKNNQIIFTIESIGNRTSSIDNKLYTIKYLDDKKLVLVYMINGSPQEEVYFKK